MGLKQDKEKAIAQVVALSALTKDSVEGWPRIKLPGWPFCLQVCETELRMRNQNCKP